MPDNAQLDKDIWFVSSANPLIKTLMIWRNNIIAHRGPEVALGTTQILIRNPLSEEDLTKLLEESHAILNRYSEAFSASSYPAQVSGHDDYKWLLKLIRSGMQKKTRGQGQRSRKSLVLPRIR